MIDSPNLNDFVMDVVHFSKAPGGRQFWWKYRNYRLRELPKEVLDILDLSVSDPKIYIAGPMRGKTDYNFKEFDNAANYLGSIYDVVNPIDLDRADGYEYREGIERERGPLDDTTLKAMMDRDLKALSSCQYIYMLRGWGNSKGALLEKAFAEYNGIEILYQDESENNRKGTPVFSGVMKYFPNAIKDIARCSLIGNDQHNPGSELHWDRSKSGDELDALARHLLEAGTLDTDGVRHSTKVAWRALANLEKEIESE